MLPPRPPPPALSDAPLAPGLYLVATPIGNLRDITLRALDVLAAADFVLAEDTRVTAKLLSAYGLAKRLERYDEHAAARARPKALAALAQGARVALVSDAGTPLVSDPGYRLVTEALAAGAAVWPIPGASSALAALSVAGLPTDRFLFAGFPPPKSAARCSTASPSISPPAPTRAKHRPSLAEGGPRCRPDRRRPRSPTRRSRPASTWSRRRSGTCATSPCGRSTCWRPPT